MKNAHLTKGSELSYKLLFKLLFAKNVELAYPNQQMLRASDGHWNQELSLFVKVDYGNVTDIVGRLVDITSGGRTIRVLVDRKESLVGEVDRIVRIGGQYTVDCSAPINSYTLTALNITNIRIGQSVSGNGIPENTKVVSVANNSVTLSNRTILTVNGQITFTNEIYELFLDKKFFGVVNIGDKVKFMDTFQATVLPVTNKLVVSQPGKSFRVGQVFELQAGEGTGALLKVTAVDKTNNNGIKYAEFIKFGLGYDSDFALSILSSNSVNTSTQETVLNSSTNRVGDNIYITDRIAGLNEEGYINRANYFPSGYVDGTYVGEIVRQFSLNYKNAQVESDDPAIISVNLGAMARYPGYYTSNSGFLDDSIYIQDSRYYQTFSYVVKIDERLSTYKSIVKSLIHPAGMALFGEYSINNTFDLSLTLQSLVKALGVKVSDEIFIDDGNLVTQFVSKALADSVDYIADTVSKFDIGKSLEDTLPEQTDALTQLFSKSLNAANGYTDEYVTMLEGSLTQDFSKALADTYSGFGDVLTQLTTKSLSDLTIPSDSTALLVTSKSLQDTLDNQSEVFVQIFSKDISAPNGYLDEIVTMLETTPNFDVGMALAESYSGMIESSVFLLEKPLSDSLLQPDDSTVLTTAKYLLDSDVGTFENSGDVWLNPYQDIWLEVYFAENYSDSLATSFTA
jgi:hypothetical protein